MITRHKQTRGYDAHRALGPLGTVATAVPRAAGGFRSPYFQRNTMREEGPGGNTHLFLNIMTKTCVVVSFAADDPYTDAIFAYWDDTTPFTYHGLDGVQFMPNTATDSASYLALAKTALNSYAAAHSFTWSKIIFAFADSDDVATLRALIPAGLASAPQAAIGAATTTLATNYNLATGILGLATALNTANTAQNDMATKLNTLVTELVTLGLIHA